MTLPEAELGRLGWSRGGVLCGAFQRAGRGGAGMSQKPHPEAPPQGKLASGSTLCSHLKGSLFPPAQPLFCASSLVRGSAFGFN